jgi:hypothetical protein
MLRTILGMQQLSEKYTVVVYLLRPAPKGS